MSSAIENARKRLTELKRQLAELERFIQIYEELDAGTDADRTDTHAGHLNGALKGNNPVDNVPSPSGNVRACGAGNAGARLKLSRL